MYRVVKSALHQFCYWPLKIYYEIGRAIWKRKLLEIRWWSRYKLYEKRKSSCYIGCKKKNEKFLFHLFGFLFGWSQFCLFDGINWKYFRSFFITCLRLYITHVFDLNQLSMPLEWCVFFSLSHIFLTSRHVRTKSILARKCQLTEFNSFEFI